MASQYTSMTSSGEEWADIVGLSIYWPSAFLDFQGKLLTIFTSYADLST